MFQSNRIIDSKNITKSPTDIIYDSTNKKIYIFQQMKSMVQLKL